MDKLDDIDKKILSLLQDDARISNLALSDIVGLSPSACLRRVQALDEKGVITGYTALINEKRLGYGTQVIVMVTLSGQEFEKLKAFEDAVESIPNVLACYLMGGGYDYLMRISVKDIDDYESLHRKVLSTLPHVVNLRSNFALREVIRRSNQLF